MYRVQSSNCMMRVRGGGLTPQEDKMGGVQFPTVGISLAHTCPSAETPLSVLPPLEKAHPSRLSMSLVLRRPSSSFASTVSTSSADHASPA